MREGRSAVPWLLKALLLMVKTGFGRRLLLAIGLGTFQLAKRLRAPR